MEMFMPELAKTFKKPLLSDSKYTTRIENKVGTLVSAK